MNSKEVEEKTGLARSNIRFYEKENLISPARNDSNGYREYSEQDVEDIKKIACLRTLGISIEEIRQVITGENTLSAALRKRSRQLEGQITELHMAKALCDKMLNDTNISYEKLQVEQYVTKIPEYWSEQENQKVFKLDSVSFLYLWGSFFVWVAITVLCLLVSILSYGKLPQEIPVQWSGDTVVSLADRKIIFVFPAVCIVIRYLVRPSLYTKTRMFYYYGEILAEYLTNYLCFVLLSIQIFTILFLHDIVESVLSVLILDTAVLIGLLITGLLKDSRPKKT